MDAATWTGIMTVLCGCLCFGLAAIGGAVVALKG